MHFTIAIWIYAYFLLSGPGKLVLLALSNWGCRWHWRKIYQLCHWHRWTVFGGLVDTGINFRLLGYFWQVSMTPVKMLSPAIIFHWCRWYWWKIYHRCRCHRRSLFSGVIDTSDKFITGVVVTSDNCSAVSLIPVINLSAVSFTPPNSLSPVWLMPLINIHSRLSPRIFEKKSKWS